MKLRSILIGLTILALGGPATVSPALAAGGAEKTSSGPAGGLALAMTLYAGGITLGKVDMDAKFAGDRYNVTSNLETSGVVNAFWQSQIQATSSGILEKSKMVPSSYQSFYSGVNAKHQEVSLTYENGNPVRLYANPTYPTTGYEVKPEEKVGSFDPLSTVVYIASGVGAEPGNPCAVKVPVFDGRRRYNVGFTKVKPVTIAMDNGLYKGPALLCSIEYKQISGYKPRVLRETNFPAINAWIGLFRSPATGRNFAVPLRVWAKTQYGVIAAVTNSLAIDGAPAKPAN